MSFVSSPGQPPVHAPGMMSSGNPYMDKNRQQQMVLNAPSSPYGPYLPGSPYAQGGSVKNLHDNMMIKVHMSPQEIQDLSEMQGGEALEDDGTGEHIPSFRGLGMMFKHPMIERMIATQADFLRGGSVGGYAHGGSVHEAHMGRFGDSKLAMITPHTKNMLDHLIGRPATINPHTGHPEYFLGALLGGLKSLAGPALGALKSMAPQLIGSAANWLGDKIGGWFGGGNQQQGAESQQGGASPQGSPQQGAGPQMPQPQGRPVPSLGSIFGSGFEGLNQGKGLFESIGPQLGQYIQGFGQGSQNPLVRGLTSGIGGAVNAFGGGANPMQSIMQGINQGIEGAMPAYGSQQEQSMNPLLRGLGRGAQGFSQAMMAPQSSLMESLGYGAQQGAQSAFGGKMPSLGSLLGQGMSQAGEALFGPRKQLPKPPANYDPQAQEKAYYNSQRTSVADQKPFVYNPETDPFAQAMKMWGRQDLTSN